MNSLSSDLTVAFEATNTEVKRYQRQKLLADVGATVVSLLALAVLALFAGPKVDELLRAWTGDNRWLRLLALGFLCLSGLKLLTAPLVYWSEFVLEHRHQLSDQPFPSWVWRQVKAFLVQGALNLVLLLGMYALLWFTGSWWWLWATVGWLLGTLVLGWLWPVVILPLFYKVTRLDDPELLERLRHLSRGTGLDVEGVYRLHLSAETRKANAALAGQGRTRRVLLGDTLLEQFTPEEIEVVFAHEVGHHVYRHAPKRVAWSMALSAAGLWLVDGLLRHAAANLGYPAWDDPATLPLVLLAWFGFAWLLAPLENALSRCFERQADRYALEQTGRPAAYRSLFVKLAQVNKHDPDPHPLVVWLFDSHPPIRQRLAVADQLANPATG